MNEGEDESNESDSEMSEEQDEGIKMDFSASRKNKPQTQT